MASSLTPGMSVQDMIRACRANPDMAGCDEVPNFYAYRLSLGANAALAALFGLSLVGFLAVFLATRRGVAFTVAMGSGVILEVLGYAGRLMSWKNQWNENGFLMQICCLTIAPAFMAAGIYLCLRRIVYAFGPENSRIRPELYTRIFIPCDVISLVLQAAGGAMASIASHNDQSVDLGDNIMIAGLAFQVATLVLFIGCTLDFAIHTARRHRQLGAAAFDQTAAARSQRSSPLFKGCLAALALATLCIFIRSVFRVAELSGGWSGPIMKRQDLFIAFEGAMVIIACLALNIFHPSFCIGDVMDGAGGIGAGRRKNKVAAAAARATGKSEPVSEAEP